MESKFDNVLSEFVDGAYDQKTRFVEDLGLDSLSMTGLLQQLEEAFGTRVSMPKPAPSTVGELRAMFEASQP